MISLYDARKKNITLSQPAKRIISLVPSTTESLIEFGCHESLVGITRYCPRHLCPNAKLVGGTKNIIMERILALEPDLVVGNIEENTSDIFTQIEAAKIPLYAAFPRTVDEALYELQQLAILVNKPCSLQTILQNLAQRRTQASHNPFSFVYVIWRNPWMAVNGDTFISSLLAEVGGQNHFAQHQTRYFSFTWDEVQQLQNTQILLSSEPFPFHEKHRKEWINETSIPASNIKLIDGAMCSWHGVRLTQSLSYLRDFFTLNR